LQEGSAFLGGNQGKALAQRLAPHSLLKVKTKKKGICCGLCGHWIVVSIYSNDNLIAEFRRELRGCCKRCSQECKIFCKASCTCLSCTCDNKYVHFLPEQFTLKGQILGEFAEIRYSGLDALLFIND